MTRMTMLAGGLVLAAVLSGTAFQPEGEVPAPADPADVGSIDALMTAWYESTAGPAGQPRDWDRFRSLFLAEGRLIAARPKHEGGAVALVLSVDDYVQANVYLEKAGYFDSEIARRVDRFGNIAHVFSTYESRRVKDEPKPYSRGINSIQLLFDGTRWWILNVTWDYERSDNPLPEAYTAPNEP